MVHKDPEVRQAFMRQYQLTWMWRRRLTWILENGPCRWCGSVDNLVVSFRLPWEKTMKVASIWGRTDAIRAEVLAKCEVLCSECHRKKTAIYNVLRSVLN